MGQFFKCGVIAGALVCSSSLLLATWSAPTTLDTFDNITSVGGAPDIALDPASDAVAVWSESNVPGPLGEIRSAGATCGVWGPFVEVASATGGGSGPMVRVDAAGDAIAIWNAPNSSGMNSVFSATKPFGGSWENIIQANVGTRAIRPVLTVDAIGTAYGAWIAATGAASNPQVGVLPYLASSWSLTTFPEQVVGGSGGAPQIASNECAGQAIVVWVNTSGAVQSSFFSGGTGVTGTWGPVLTVATDPSYANAFTALDAFGNAAVVWAGATSAGAATEILASTLPFGATAWSTPPAVLAVGPAGPATPKVATSPTGHAVAVWSISNGVNDVIQAATADLPINTWTPTDQVSPNDGLDATDPVVGVDFFGDAVCAWLNSDITLSAATLTAGQTAWVAQPITASARELALSVNSCGNAALIWNTALSATGNAIQTSTGTDLFGHCSACPTQNFESCVTPPTPPAPPSHFHGRTLENRFLTQTDVIHHLTWEASPTSTVVGYILRRDGHFLAFIPQHPGILTYNDHNRTDHTDTYTLIAVTSTHQESTPVTIVVGR